jgi:hypothetical protein
MCDFGIGSVDGCANPSTVSGGLQLSASVIPTTPAPTPATFPPTPAPGPTFAVVYSNDSSCSDASATPIRAAAGVCTYNPIDDSYFSVSDAASGTVSEGTVGIFFFFGDTLDLSPSFVVLTTLSLLLSGGFGVQLL